jgi:hypothetical protein
MIGEEDNFGSPLRLSQVDVPMGLGIFEYTHRSRKKILERITLPSICLFIRCLSHASVTASITVVYNDTASTYMGNDTYEAGANYSA